MNRRLVFLLLFRAAISAPRPQPGRPTSGRSGADPRATAA